MRLVEAFGPGERGKERDSEREGEGLGCAEWRRSAGEREREGGRGTRMR
jgi:hypothetical protein